MACGAWCFYHLQLISDICWHGVLRHSRKPLQPFICSDDGKSVISICIYCLQEFKIFRIWSLPENLPGSIQSGFKLQNFKTVVPHFLYVYLPGCFEGTALLQPYLWQC